MALGLCYHMSASSSFRLLVAVASLAAEHKLWSAGSAVMGHRLSCPRACGIFEDQGLNSCPLHWLPCGKELAMQET